MHRFFHVTKDGALEPKTGLEDCLKGRGSAGYIWLDYKDFLVTVRSGKRSTRWSEDEIEAGIKREAVEDAIIREAAGFDLRRLSHLRNALLAMRKELFHEREALVKVCRRDFTFFSERYIYHYRDVYDHLTKLFGEIEVYREILISLAEMHLSLANNRMSRLANKTNMTVRRLTLITTIFMPLTLLAGVCGMSEFTMMTGQANWKTSYPLFMAGMAVVGAASYLVLRLMESRAKDATD